MKVLDKDEVDEVGLEMALDMLDRLNKESLEEADEHIHLLLQGKFSKEVKQ